MKSETLKDQHQRVTGGEQTMTLIHSILFLKGCCYAHSQSAQCFLCCFSHEIRPEIRLKVLTVLDEIMERYGNLYEVSTSSRVS